MSAHQGTESLLELAAELEEVAPMIEEFFNHKRAAALMRKTAGVVRRLAPLDPEIEVVRGEH
jgi:hypothetical protein